MPRPSPLRRLLLAIGIAGGGLVLLEVGLRVCRFEYPPVEKPVVLWNAERDADLEAKNGLYQRDLHTLWAPRPGAEIPVRPSDSGADVERVNAGGYRGPLVPFQRTQGTLRILTLGDSAAFGIGVKYEESFSGRLAAMLAESGVKAEVIDGGVEGYTLRQGLERYRWFGRMYKPNIVIVAFSGANESTAARDLADEDKLAVNLERNSGLTGFARKLRRHVRTLALASWVKDRHALKEVLAASAESRRHEEELAGDAGNPDWGGTRRVSPGEFAMYLGELRRAVSADGARIILVAMPHRGAADDKSPVLRQYTRAIFTTAVGEDAQILNAKERFEVRVRNDGAESTMFLDDWNPTPFGHDLMAQWLLALVREHQRNRGGDPADSLR